MDWSSCRRCCSFTEPGFPLCSNYRTLTKVWYVLAPLLKMSGVNIPSKHPILLKRATSTCRFVSKRTLVFYECLGLCGRKHGGLRCYTYSDRAGSGRGQTQTCQASYKPFSGQISGFLLHLGSRTHIDNGHYLISGDNEQEKTKHQCHI